MFISEIPSRLFLFSIVMFEMCKCFQFFFDARVLWTMADLAEKIQATKVKAADANDTAVDVLNRLKDMNLNLMGLKRNYSKLEDDVNKANNLIKDPEKNSTTSTQLQQ